MSSYSQISFALREFILAVEERGVTFSSQRATFPQGESSHSTTSGEGPGAQGAGFYRAAAFFCRP